MSLWSLGWQDTLEKEMTTHFSILTWRIPGEVKGETSKALSYTPDEVSLEDSLSDISSFLDTECKMCCM